MPVSLEVIYCIHTLTVLCIHFYFFGDIQWKKILQIFIYQHF